MKTFTVQGYNWREDYEVDDSLFDSYEDMAFEAMTLALDEYMSFPDGPSPVWHSSCEHVGNEVPEWGDGYKRESGESLQLGWTTMAWEKGYEREPNKKVAALTELVLRNSGHHETANKIRVQWEKARRREDEGYF
jgi:hypothetical protein